jgi:hypothetical protein
MHLQKNSMEHSAKDYAVYWMEDETIFLNQRGSTIIMGTGNDTRI